MVFSRTEITMLAINSMIEQSAAKFAGLKSEIDHLEFLYQSGGVDQQLTDKISKIEQGLGKLQGSNLNHGDFKDSPLLKEVSKFENSSSDDFRQWQESVKDCFCVKLNGLEALEWAISRQTDEPITVEEVENMGYGSISKEVWCILGFKTRAAPWRLRLSIAHQNGLEHWRQLAAEYNPQSETQAAVLCHQLLAPPAATPTTLMEVLSRVEAAVTEHDRMAAKPMEASIRRTIYEKVCPPDWLSAMRLSGNDVSTAAKLRSRMMLHLRSGRESAKLKGLG